MELNNDFLQKVQGAIVQTWSAVGSDACACSEEMGETMTNEVAMETVLDANRLTMYGHADVDKLVMEAINEHGYVKVDRFLRKHIKLA